MKSPNSPLAAQQPEVNIKIVAFNDFHGQLEPLGDYSSVADDSQPKLQVGGVDWLAGYFADLKRKNPNTTVVSAGDLIGASPLISALFHDEGTMETMNRAGLEISAVGNHEFDEGKDELLRMQSGGCHPIDKNSCQGDSVGTPFPFEGARFDYLAANVYEGGTTIFPAYKIKEYDGVKVAYIGLTLKETPTVVMPTGVQGLNFTDEAETINQLVPKLRRESAEAIVVLIHQGGETPVVQAASTINDCEGGLADSPIKKIVSDLSDEVDLVISGHTHQAYNCLLPTRNKDHLIPVTSANAQGRIITEIDLSIDKHSGRIKNITPVNRVVDRANATITPNQEIQRIVEQYKIIAKPLTDRVIGSITQTLSRTPNAAGESPLGDIIADSQLAATKPSGSGDAVVAFLNPGSIRTDLIYSGSDGDVTVGEAFAVQPFGNNLITMTLTGAQIEKLLEQQFTGCPNAQPFNRILQVSAGFSYAWNPEAAPCDKVDPSTIRLNGGPIDPKASYRVTVNNFLADGGDKFGIFKDGSNRLGGILDIDALVNYFKTHSPVSPTAQNRILAR
ncbi:bifunctional metallophosphatase/5'-nucleotidase [Methylobacter sp. YRD-M1]|uniref:bifunctional metallophosphatase/5'-nucleotidase n=1 Tax=Methylobacter sp. YRD-M1 TaxID=2911520 RepID=UPI00227C7D57|nr:bifunctional metallophosphatase/5'-nucleotidase [Methylobacter sp. YRD-M1]WAK03849.1 bifunctional metallophosphatase/5'-nucleotidase [Methylobacter sp. YRD-M1]